MKKILSILVAVLILVGLVGCAASENTDQSGATTSAQNKNSILTAEEAQAAALEHAGLAAEQVTLLHTRYQIDDGIAEYEVEFRYEDQEYDYTIHAETGEILEFDQEREPVVETPTQGESAVNPPADATEPTQAPQPEATEPTQQPQTDNKLTREQAQAIALEHAGFQADQVTQLYVEYDVDDGVPEYSVEFRKGDVEYEYDIHAETGKIREIHKDRDPVDSPAVAVPQDQPAATEPSKSKLSRDEARDIALKHAGVELSDIHGLEIEYDVDDGVPEYSVEFRVGTWELDYEIHAETGKILKSEKDRND